MYLKEIIANGFKSFADKIDIKLDNKITCIVGPNGSGKSNIVDAVRWVLGEQSVKSLRGDGSMSDVIFSGSKSRNPLNVASVELIFDNTDHYLNVAYTEISIKRRVYRTGENEYFLNHEKCRLKDINNLLMDTGMGKDSFNIISQGEVDKILSNSSYDRRAIFEEASGILKYKKRKEEALKRLDKTHNNLDRVNDIITELTDRLEPLKEQKEKASLYLENKKGLDKYEVALLAYDISTLNNSLELAKEKKQKLDEEIIGLSTEVNKNDSKYLEETNRLEKLSNELGKLQRQLLNVTEDATRIEGEKNLLKEKSKTSKEEDEIKENIRSLIEEREKISSDVTLNSAKLNDIEELLNNKNNELKEAETNLKNEQSKKKMLINNYSKTSQELISLKYRITNLKGQIEQGTDMPNSVRSILKSNELTGIYNTIGNVLSVEDKYAKALNVAITGNKNYIITKDEASSKKAIAYLKDNHLGRATFFPLSVIKERYIDYNSLNILKNSNDYIGIMSDLVKYNKDFTSVIKNQLGTVIVSTNIDSATRLSHMINQKYKIVTLDGNVVNIGGSLTGGSSNNSKSIIILKQELKHLEEQYINLQDEDKNIQEKLKNNNEEISKIEEITYKISKEKVSLKEEYDKKKNELVEIKNKLISISKEYESLELINSNNVSKKEEELIKDYHEKMALKEQIESHITNISLEIEKIKDNSEKYQAEEKLITTSLHAKEKLSRELEIEINRIDVKLDNLLQNLSSEYEMTYDKARSEYILDIDPEEARRRVSTYKNNIKNIGMVNLDSIEEYKQVNSRFEFLNNQKSDLLKAEDSLLEIMNEMDEVMKEEFKNTFENIRVEFQKVFKELFMGGNADLKLTDSSNLLETGVDIVASPPGKKLTTITLLSGGEKTLTAISLLFAILNVRKVPFCLFDEVEAALDEANVGVVGKYLNNYQDKTQFLIITHKKKTMEYAHTLYGITMQESGVSKLVSVHLEDHEEVL